MAPTDAALSHSLCLCPVFGAFPLGNADSDLPDTEADGFTCLVSVNLVIDAFDVFGVFGARLYCEDVGTNVEAITVGAIPKGADVNAEAKVAK